VAFFVVLIMVYSVVLFCLSLQVLRPEHMFFQLAIKFNKWVSDTDVVRKD